MKFQIVKIFFCMENLSNQVLNSSCSILDMVLPFLSSLKICQQVFIVHLLCVKHCSGLFLLREFRETLDLYIDIFGQ